ncbi:glycosyltransferase family 2 protein [Poriferisphaera sp. WC338]|uniref:glycosyltransferase family 2 protein n=1 Tax=Poriferisphaera sp. WC338 TaxID=3425129 RepID=UPI003D81860E
MNQYADTSRNATSSPAIAVVMPVYNRAKYLHAAIRSILNQTFTDFQFIIVNDGSTDDSRAIIESYIDHDPRITLINQTNAGCYAARNAALEITTAPFTAITDSDDMAHPDRLQKQYDFLIANPDHVAVGSLMRLTDPFGVPNQLINAPEHHDAIDNHHMQGNPGALIHGTVTLRTNALRQLGGYTLAPNSADYDLALRLAEIGKLANLTEPLQYVRTHFASISSTSRADQINRARAFCKQAHIRRGLDCQLSKTINRDAQTNAITPADQAASWARYAVHAKRLNIARRHAATAIKHDPFNLENWRIMKWALTG